MPAAIAYVDADGDVYAADRSYGSGPYGYVRRGSARSTGHSIAGTTEDGRYKNLREDMTAYKFAVANGFYQVDLSFAELQFRHVGDRVFDVSLEGTRVLRSLDIVEEAGGATRALDKIVRGRGDRWRARHRVRLADAATSRSSTPSSSRACRRARRAPEASRSSSRSGLAATRGPNRVRERLSRGRSVTVPTIPYASWPGRWQMYCCDPGPRRT